MRRNRADRGETADRNRTDEPGPANEERGVAWPKRVSLTLCQTTGPELVIIAQDPRFGGLPRRELRNRRGMPGT